MNCRHCNAPLATTVLDLGFAPPSNAYLRQADLVQPQTYYPLRIMVCECCWLVQTEDYAPAKELFRDDYAYFSSTSKSWLAHAAKYARESIEQFKLGPDSLVIEIACNDGYLLKNFILAGIPCLGIEPTASTAAVAELMGIQVMREFFGAELGRRLAVSERCADLIVGNNVYAHVPDINDFTIGLKTALKPRGIVTLEFPHLMRLIKFVQFDTIYHEHFSYLSLYTVTHIFQAAGLRVWHVERLTTHGGSLRVYGCHADDPRPDTGTVSELLAEEEQSALRELATYHAMQARADRVKDDLLEFLLRQKRAGRTVAGYGAAAKGNTLLNYAGVRRDLLPFVCDAAIAKQGKFLPGSQIPILPPAELDRFRPDYLLVLPWNIAAEIREQNARLSVLGTRFVTAVPQLEIV